MNFGSVHYQTVLLSFAEAQHFGPSIRAACMARKRHERLSALHDDVLIYFVGHSRKETMIFR